MDRLIRYCTVRFFRLNTACFACLVCWFALAAQNTFACSKTMRWDDDPPFTFVGKRPSAEVQGISLDVAREIFKRLNCELKLVKMPWARALVALQSGQIDLVSGAFKTSERQAYAHYSTKPEYSPNVLFLRNGEESKWALESLADITQHPFKLGVQIDVSYSREFDALKEQAEFADHVYVNPNRLSLWKMLSLKRVDGVIADKFTGLMELKNLGLDGKIIASSLVISTEPSFFAFSKETTSKAFIIRFDAIYEQLVNDGAIVSIEKHYINQ
jgi:polar amino acid transport system substrate-binding protein